MRALTLLPVVAALSASLFSLPATAQQFKDPANLGPNMPTPESVVDEMLRAANVHAGETVYDLGCGDGRILIAAVQKYNARGVGIEMSRDIYEKTSARIKALGLDGQIRIVHGNALHTDLSSADVVTLYLLTSSNERLKPSLEKMHAGARVVSHDFEIRGWKPATVTHVPALGRDHTVFVYEIKPKQ